MRSSISQVFLSRKSSNDQFSWTNHKLFIFHSTIMISTSLIYLVSTASLLLHPTFAYTIPNVSSSKSSNKAAAVRSSPSSVDVTTKSQTLLPSLVQKGLSTLALATAITISSSTAILPTAYAESDYATETSTTATTSVSSFSSNVSPEDTVEVVIQNLKDATGDSSKTIKVFENISEIITEGAGVGGSLSYSKY